VNTDFFPVESDIGALDMEKRCRESRGEIQLAALDEV
jgi:hypothetical protein